MKNNIYLDITIKIEEDISNWQAVKGKFLSKLQQLIEEIEATEQRISGGGFNDDIGRLRYDIMVE